MEPASLYTSKETFSEPRMSMLKTLIDATNAPVALLDKQGRLKIMNQVLEKEADLNILFSNARVRPLVLHSRDGANILFPREQNDVFSISIGMNRVEDEHLKGLLITNVWKDIHWLSINTSTLSHHEIPETQHELLQSVLDCIPARLFWKDKRSRYLGSNTLFAKDCGFQSSKDLMNKSDYDFFPDAEADNFRADDAEVMRTGIPKINIEEPLTRPDGTLTWLLTNKVPIKNRCQEVVGVMGSYTDITKQKNYQSMIERQARFDHLTGLANRLALAESIENLEADTNTDRGGLLFLDLDYFKTVNDTLGHQTGDKLLQQVAERINEVVGHQRLICRLGGDEFAVLIVFDKRLTEKETENQLKSIANNLLKRIIQPYQVDQHQLQLGVSIGVSTFSPQGKEKNIGLNGKILDEADIAMYDAKNSGRNNVRVFNQSMRSTFEYTLHLQSQLAFALDNKELFLEVQPQYNQHNQWVGGELLLRWHHPELGRVAPDVFIPVSEQCGSIHRIGAWVIEQAFLLVKRWSSILPKKMIFPLAVNISPIQFNSEDLIPLIEDLLERIPIDPSLIEIELTENCIFKNTAIANEKLNLLRQRGFRLAIDDFGTGYSNLRALCDLPFQKLKVDKSLIKEIGCNPKLTTITSSIFTMADQLALSVIAEGVETQHQLDHLCSTGYKYFQGYFFSRPLSLDTYEKQFIFIQHQ